ncbi:MAG: ABC transporter ATP-binding protein [Polyangiaceae bacterium]|nr:ABC transporter ATP-binding protein [Polyangiaceae bacterium]
MSPHPIRLSLADSTRLTDHVRRHLLRYAAGLGLLGSYQFAQYWFDTRLMRAIDEALAGRAAVAIRYGLTLALVALVAFLVRVLSRVVIFNAGRIAEYELRNTLLARLHRLGPSFYRHMSPGDIMSRATNDLNQVRLLLGFGALNVINTAFALVSALSVALTISVRLTLASLATFPALMLVTRGFGRRLYARTRANQQALGDMSGAVQSSVAGIRVVRAFALEESEISRFERANRNYLDKSLSLARLRGSMGPVMQAISAVGMLIVFWYGGHLLLLGEIRPGGFLAFYRALARLTWPLMALGFLVGMVQRGRASYSRLKEIYDAAVDVGDGCVSSDGWVARVLEVRSLCYAFGGRPVLSDVSFTLQHGESLAIVGRTGSGKSTLARVLARLEPTPRGAVFLDGRDICDLPVSAVRSAIGLSQQDPFLFSTTAARNIGYTLDDPESAQGRQLVTRAARDAQVCDELMTLPDGLDTVVGERGVQLSGGQKQRVALGRAFVYRPRFLVLDDPLSAVDARTEKAILEAIDRQRSERSLILITHRVAAAAHCDRVLVLDQGRIVEQGTPEELAHQGGLYQRFAAEQRLASELEERPELAQESA